MAQGKTNLQEDRNLNWIKGTSFAAAPASVYLGLYTTAPDDTGGGTEVSGSAYARQAVTFGAITNVANGPDSMASNADALFPVATGSWGTIVAVGLFDASSAGNLIMWATITSVTINTNDQLKFPSGNVTVTED